MNVLLGCEESQAVCIEFRKRGHKAYSCDTQNCSGGHPGWHIMEDILIVINGGNFTTQSGENIFIERWNLAIFFPPCTDIAVSGAAHFKKKIADGRQQKAIDFFMKLANSNIDKIAIENPVSIMSSIYRPPDQIIHPYYFGDEAQKTTCLWLKNLPLLYHNSQPNLFDENVTHVGKGEMMKCVRKDGRIEFRARHNQGLPPSADRGKIRSKTFEGIAKAMAAQWS